MEESKMCEFDTDFSCDFEVEFETVPDEIDCIFCHFSSLEHISHQTIDLIGRRARLSLGEARRVMVGLCLFDRKIASSIMWLKKYYPEKWKHFRELHEKRRKETKKEAEKYRRMQEAFFSHLTGKGRDDAYRI